MATTYTVKKGDTLPQIAENYKDVIRDENGNLISTNEARTNYLAKINDITDPTRIVVGQTIIISGSAASAPNPNAGHISGPKSTVKICITVIGKGIRPAENKNNTEGIASGTFEVKM